MRKDLNILTSGVPQETEHTDYCPVNATSSKPSLPTCLHIMRAQAHRTPVAPWEIPSKNARHLQRKTKVKTKIITAACGEKIKHE